LLAESALNRQVLQLEASHIQIRVERFKRSWWQTGWKFGAPVAGFLLTRKFKLAKGILTKGSFALLILRKLWEVWLSRKR
jgi:hypothetical protein